MKHTLLLLTGLAFLTLNNQAQTTVTDYDGNVYNTVTIGTQTWMKENLKVTHYRNGNSIPDITNNSTWSNLTTGAKCYYNNDSITNDSIYGALYNWFTANNSNLCPVGWHIPTYDEWTTLDTYLGGGISSGGEMKETDTIHWMSPNTDATNYSGFTGLPGGYRGGSFFEKKKGGYWWSCTELDASVAFYYLLRYNNAGFSPANNLKTVGGSIRCVKDSTSVQINDINHRNKLQIYPNPVIDKLTISFAENQSIKMQVYNINGKCIIQRELTNWTNEIDIGSLSKGVYVVRLIGADWTVARKLTKE
jgi:uncharacterized protein (TIGR02145 family)